MRTCCALCRCHVASLTCVPEIRYGCMQNRLKAPISTMTGFSRSREKYAPVLKRPKQLVIMWMLNEQHRLGPSNDVELICHDEGGKPTLERKTYLLSSLYAVQSSRRPGSITVYSSIPKAYCAYHSAWLCPSRRPQPPASRKWSASR